MNKAIILTITIILTNILPIYSLSETDGIDMTTYSNIAGYGFFVVMLIFFSLFLYYSGRPADEPIKVMFEKPAAAAAGTFTSEIFPALNLAYYSVIILLVLFVLSFILMIS